MGRRYPPRHPHRGVRRTPRLLRGLRFAGHAGADAAARLFPRRHLLVVPAAPARAAAGHAGRIPATRLLAYTCTHDQVGNRALGDRPSQNLTAGQLAIKAALVLGSPYTAMLFMGEEWGASTPFQFFSSHPEPELARATAEGRKAEFAGHGWDADDIPDPQDPQTFQRSKLNWSEVGAGEHARLAAGVPRPDRVAAQRGRPGRPLAGAPRRRLRRGPALDHHAPRPVGDRVQPGRFAGDGALYR